MGKLRAAIITDIHYGTDDRATLGLKASRYIDSFVKAANDLKVDAVIEMGDRISARSPERDKDLMKKLKGHFNKLAAPVHSLSGNHDIVNVTEQENEQITGSPARHYSVDVQGFHIVCWNPVSHNGQRGTLTVKKGDLDWLRQDLAETDKPTIVFSHIPLDNVSEQWNDDGGEDFANRFGYPKKGAEIRKILEDSGKVKLVMSGHIHKNRERKINGIPYVAQQSWAHEYKKPYRILSRTWSVLEADDNEITITLQGKIKRTYQYSLSGEEGDPRQQQFVPETELDDSRETEPELMTEPGPDPDEPEDETETGAEEEPPPPPPAGPAPPSP